MSAKTSASLLIRFVLFFFVYSFIFTNNSFVFCIEGNGDISVEDKHFTSELESSPALSRGGSNGIFGDTLSKDPNHFNLFLHQASSSLRKLGPSAPVKAFGYASAFDNDTYLSFPLFSFFSLPSQTIEKHSATVLLI